MVGWLHGTALCLTIPAVVLGMLGVGFLIGGSVLVNRNSFGMQIVNNVLNTG